MATVRVGVSPFQCSSDICFLNEAPIKNALTIRVESGSSLKVGIKIYPDTYLSETQPDPSASNCDYYLDGGDSIEITRKQIETLDQVRFIALTGNPQIFWSNK